MLEILAAPYTIKLSTFHNLSNIIPPAFVSRTLGLGLKHIFPSEPPSLDDVSNALSSFCNDIQLVKYLKILKTRNETQERNFIKQFHVNTYWRPPLDNNTKIYNTLTKSLIADHFKQMNNVQVINTDFVSTKNWLRAHSELLVVATDKNLGLALISKTLYNDLVMRHLQNPATYQLIAPAINFRLSDHTLKSWASINEFTNDIWKPIIPNTEHYNNVINLDNFQIPKFKILPKIHKPDLSGRPIAGACAWITTQTSKILSHVLREIIKDWPHILKNSQSLINTCENHTIPHNAFLVTFDVVSLYPNMDHTAIFNAVNNLVFPSNSQKQWSLDASRFILKNSFVKFNNSVYRQKTGIAMGTNAAPELANIYVTDLVENKPIISSNKHILLWKRFIDDIFTIWTGSRDSLLHFFRLLNKLHPSLQFTMKASRSKIEFLDTWITIDHNRCLTFSVYQKPLNKYLYLPHISNHAPHCKKGFIKGELTRYARLCTKLTDFITIKQLFFLRLEAKGYPPSTLLTSIFSTVHHSCRLPQTPDLPQPILDLIDNVINGPQDDDSTKERIYIKLTYHPSLLPINSILQTYFISQFDELKDTHTPSISFKNHPNVGKIFTEKHRHVNDS
jgi:Reverse transcriptase (RNA-dependent DNA polymerase)